MLMMFDDVPAPDGSGCPVDLPDVLGLEGRHALVDVLEDVVFRHGQEVVDSGDVVDGVRQDPHLVDPRVAEHVNVLLSHFALGPSS